MYKNAGELARDESAANFARSQRAGEGAGYLMLK